MLGRNSALSLQWSAALTVAVEIRARAQCGCNHARITAYAVGLGAACLLGWLAYVAFATAVPAGTRLLQERWDALTLIWVAPAIYLAAWQLLTWRNLVLALGGAIVTAMVSAVTFFAAWFFGVFTLGLATFPIGILGVTLICAMLRAFDTSEAEEGKPATPFGVHAAALICAMFMVVSVSGGIRSDDAGLARFDRDAAAAALVLGTVALLFAPHAAATWFLGPRRLPAWVLTWRALGFCAVVWLGMAAALATVHPAVTAALWPFQLASLQARVQEEIAIFRSAGDRVIGFSAGETFDVRTRTGTIQARVPEGWLGSLGWANPTRRGPHSAIALLPDTRRAAAGDILVRRITVRERPTLTEVRDADAIDEVPFPRLWQAAGCRTEGEGADTMIACRRIVGRSVGVSFFAAQRIPLETMTTRLILDRDGDGPFFFGAGVQGSCRNAEECNLWFPARDGLAVWVQLTEAALPQWRAARDRAFAVMREAAGIEPDNAPAWLSPDGALRLPD